MAIPVINTTTSVQEGTQWQAFNYQPFATNNPTAWDCPNLPLGLEIDADTGLISGTPEVSGVFVLGLVAENGDGESAPLPLTIGILPGLATVTRPGPQLKWDLGTGKVSFLSSDTDGKLFVKVGKDLLIWLFCEKDGAPVAPNAAAVSISAREFDPDPNITISTAWKKFGEGSGTYFGIYARVEGPTVQGAVLNYEADDETQFEGKAELQLTETNPELDLGPEELLFASKNFPIVVATAQA